jgi:putative salt-induced outer membrane protein YdiY
MPVYNARHVLLLFLSFVTVAPAFAGAQVLPGVPPNIPPLPEQKTLSLAGSAGLTITSGNKDTSTFNAGYEIIYDPKGKNLLKSDGLFLRARSESQRTADQLALNGRDEYKLMTRGYVFGQIQYLRDRFKNINYLVAPTTGLGYRFIDTPRTRFSLDTGLGGVWEQNPDLDVNFTGALTYAQKFSHQLTSSTLLTQSLLALHKTDDLSDSLHVFAAAVAAGITPRTQLKVELRDTYRNRLLASLVVNNDVALLLALVYKN